MLPDDLVSDLSVLPLLSGDRLLGSKSIARDIFVCPHMDLQPRRESHQVPAVRPSTALSGL